jgi:hypothetical protein
MVRYWSGCRQNRRVLPTDVGMVRRYVVGRLWCHGAPYTRGDSRSANSFSLRPNTASSSTATANRSPASRGHEVESARAANPITLSRSERQH